MSTYTPIATQTLASAAPSVTFSSIPQGYTDLVLVCNIAQSSGNNSLRYRFNGDADSNYSDSYLFGNGTSALSGRDTSQTSGTVYVTGSTTIETNYIVQFMNYSNTTTYKTILSRSNRANSEVAIDVGLWRNTSAINSISLAMGGTFPTNNFATGSTFSIYGIQVGDKAQKAQGGNIVTSDGTYVYHTFTSSGAFIPNEALTVDYLVVAGGGGGGSGFAGGGGAGGHRSLTSQTLSLSTNYTVTVGGGGAGAASQAFGTKGNNSVFNTTTSTGGGRGGSAYGTPTSGGTGGSGGGGGGNGTAGAGNEGSLSPAQGFNGGAGSATGGGGGGAGALGTDGVSGNSPGVTGGAGAASSITGTSITRAGGGGSGGRQDSGADNSAGGLGGAGGGGNGGSSNNGTPATSGGTNTGGGGGSSGTSIGNGFQAGAGGSGIVIIRYLA